MCYYDPERERLEKAVSNLRSNGLSQNTIEIKHMDREDLSEEIRKVINGENTDIWSLPY